MLRIANEAPPFFQIRKMNIRVCVIRDAIIGREEKLGLNRIA